MAFRSPPFLGGSEYGLKLFFSHSNGRDTGMPPNWIILPMNSFACSHSPSAISANSFDNARELMPLTILLMYKYRNAAKTSAARAWFKSSRTVDSFFTDKGLRKQLLRTGIYLGLFQQYNASYSRRQDPSWTHVQQYNKPALTAPVTC